MKRITPFTLAIAAAFGIALTPAPAAADRDDVAKIIAGLAIAGIVAKAIDDRNDRKSSHRTQSIVRDSFDSVDKPRHGRIVDGTLRHRDQPRIRANRGYKRYALPDQCLRILSTARGDRRVYANRCLKRNYKFANKLPRDCAIQVRTDRGTRVVYGSRCLSRDGWRVAGRR